MSILIIKWHLQWTRIMCLLRLPFEVDRYSQFVQAYGFSLVWLRSWVWKIFSMWFHMHFEKNASHKYKYLKCNAVAKTFPTISACVWTNWNWFSTRLANKIRWIRGIEMIIPWVWLLIWTFKVYGRRNVRLHTEHSCGLISSWCFEWLCSCGFVLKNLLHCSHLKRFSLTLLW